ncbi:MAG: carbamoyltransferase HypF [Candidatus Sericytochromatia bacterium]|nr:carbamoyltransferase HypF [Candidatus Sericytochromatia bacterium]
MTNAQQWQLQIEGTVQGLGFRPFVYRQAQQLELTGFVCNSASGVTICVQGSEERLQAFVSALQHAAPPLVAYQRFEIRREALSKQPFSRFEIRASTAAQGQPPRALMLPDLASCQTCVAEIFEPGNRRFGYAFTNCTDCGPRYSIIAGLPYDRPRTSMKDFALCAACLAEYQNPADRRFHAQPNACRICGPQLSWHDHKGQKLAAGDAVLPLALQALAEGQILALKGLGGYQLICDPRRSDSLQRLRQDKGREAKPFALMLPDLAHARRYVAVSELADRTLRSPAAPIVLLPMLAGGLQDLSPAVLGAAESQHNPRLGLMLPYSPLHHLLLAAWGRPLVVTSGNRAEEPMIYQDQAAFDTLGDIADAFVSHNRPILRPVDDSVVQLVAGQVQILRRARGYAPLPLPFVHTDQDLLALGGHLKNTIALVQAGTGQALLSQHLGDLDGPASRQLWQQTVQELPQIYALRPAALAHDLHPDYASSQAAAALSRAYFDAVPCVAVQHHRAHVLAVMAEHSLSGRVLGFAWDGAGLGPDRHSLWGGECLGLHKNATEHLGSFCPFALPGGEKALRKPLYIALGWLYARHQAGLFAPQSLPPAAQGAAQALLARLSPAERQLLPQQLARQLNTLQTSSVGRLFDAVAALLLGCVHSRFEGDAAMQLEFLARRADAASRDAGRAYTLPLQHSPAGLLQLDSLSLQDAIVQDLQQGTAKELMAWRFHQSLAQGLLQMADALQTRWSCRQIVLSGGCFQNSLLLELSLHTLQNGGYTVYWPQRVPPGDGGLALGQLLALWQNQQAPLSPFEGGPHVSGLAR